MELYYQSIKCEVIFDLFLTVHNRLGNDRTLDLFFNNTSLSSLPQKGIVFHGGTGDWLRSLKIGSTYVDAIKSATIPAITVEGVAAAIESSQRLETIDRAVIRSAMGGGYITSQSRMELLAFRSDGVYTIGKNFLDDTTGLVDSLTTPADTLRIAPGSVRIFIDGEEIDSTEYTYIPLIGQLRFNRTDIVDQTSLISVKYRIQTIPDSGLTTIELIPQNNFGQLSYVSAAYAPTAWMHPQAGFIYHRTDSTVVLLNAGIPLEFRSNSPDVYITVDPDFTINTASRHKAGGIDLRSRIGKKLGVLINTLWIDSGFASIDTLTSGFGALRHDLRTTISYDILPELPITLGWQQRLSHSGLEQRVDGTAKLRFAGLPSVDITAARNQTQGTIQSIADTVPGNLDTLDAIKTKVHIRFFETSSLLLQNLINCNRVGYDISYTDYFSVQHTQAGNGRSLFIRTIVSPLSGITLSANGLLRDNPAVQGSQSRELAPQLLVQTNDVPRGIDFTASYKINYKSYVHPLTVFSPLATDSIDRSISITIRPGAWIKALSWFSPIAGMQQKRSCSFIDRGPDYTDIVLGTTRATEVQNTRSAGIRFFPLSELYFLNHNEWMTLDSMNLAQEPIPKKGNFKTFNDLKYTLATSMFQTRWEMNHPIGSRDYSNFAFIRYNHNITNWLRLNEAWNVSYAAKETGDTLKTGPMLTAQISTSSLFFVKAFMNSHSFSINWQRFNAVLRPEPSVDYSFYARIVFFPNISVIAQNAFNFSNGTLNGFTGNYSVLFVF